MQCGFFEMDITPPLGCSIPGYFHRRPAKELFDKLYARAWVCSDGANTVAVAAMDNIGLLRATVARITDRVKVLTGIPADHVLIGCSHAHSGGPETADIDDDAFYVDFLVKRIADTIVLASQRLEPAELYFGDGWLDGYSFCRIYNMEGGELQTNPFGMNTKSSISEKYRTVLGPYREIDKSVHAVEIRRKGKTAGIVVQFTCHCDVVGSETAISADYPGEVRRRLKEHYGSDTVVLFLQGPCGNINHVDAFHVMETKHPRRYLEIGDALAAETISILKNGRPSTAKNIRAIGRDISVPLRRPSEMDLAWAEKIIREVPEDLQALVDFDTTQVDLFFAKRIIEAYERKETELLTFLQVMKIGDLGIFASPGELFSEFGDALMANSPFERTIVVAYANDDVGYIVPPELYRDGVYEARQTVFDPPAGSLMNAELLRLGTEIK